jgi:hypothetical protein
MTKAVRTHEIKRAPRETFSMISLFIYIKNPVKLDLLFGISSLKRKNVFLTVTNLIPFFGITPILFLLSECHH